MIDTFIRFTTSMLYWELERLFFRMVANYYRRRDTMALNSSILVLHHSSHYLVVDKPPDIVINSNDPQRTSLSTLLRQQFPHLWNVKYTHGFRILHRLDHATSGIFIIPLSDKASRVASKAMVDRRTDKFYLAIVRNHMAKNFYHVQLPIGDDLRPEWATVKMTTSKHPYCGKPREASTKIAVLSRGYYDYQPVTKVLMKLMTGRRHQLRVHCDHLGHTILGDFTYSDRKDSKPSRMYLHSHRYILPNSVEPLDIQTQDPFSKDEYVPTELVMDLNPNAYLVFLNENELDWTVIKE